MSIWVKSNKHNIIIHTVHNSYHMTPCCRSLSLSLVTVLSPNAVLSYSISRIVVTACYRTVIFCHRTVTLFPPLMTEVYVNDSRFPIHGYLSMLLSVVSVLGSTSHHWMTYIGCARMTTRIVLWYTGSARVPTKIASDVVRYCYFSAR